ncbi:signal peptidase I [Aeromicrobium sp.]|uniref:signal peptidase I n=1 Tax=Aeromicrobium sp. TaxID=1871063 RepID=UPI002FC757C7
MTDGARKRSRSRTGSVIRNTLLNIGAVLGVICIVVALASAFGGITPLVFRSGSMAPEIQAGALAFAKEAPVTDVAVGDIVSVRDSAGTRVTHRVVSVTLSGDKGELVLRGDANEQPDAETYTVTSVDRVFVDVPYVGHALGWARHPAALFLVGASVSGLLLFVFKPRGGTRGGGRRKAARAGTALAVLGLVGIAVPGVPGTSAAFSDTGTMTSGTVVAHTVTSQAQPTCANVDGFLVLGNIARLTWAQVNARYEYTWELRRADNNNLAASGTLGSGIAQGATVTLDISTGLIGTNTNYNVVIRARLVTPNTWVATTTTTTPVRRASIIIIGAAFRCGHA